MRIFTLLLALTFVYSCAGSEKASKRYEDYFPPIKEENGYIIFRPTDTVPGEDIGAYSSSKAAEPAKKTPPPPESVNEKTEEPVDEKIIAKNNEPAPNESNNQIVAATYEPVLTEDNYDVKYATPAEIASAPKQSICGVKMTGARKTGKPYMIAGEMYYPLESGDGFTEEGVASWYGPGFHGQKTANGEIYNQKAMTAAHKTLPIPTLVSVRNLENGKEAIVRINDRGPFSKGRIIDLSEAAANRVGMVDKGTARVKITVLSESSDCYVAEGKEVKIDVGDFAVQIAAFIDPANAEDLVMRMNGKASISFGDIDGKTWNRVLMGGYQSRSAADDAVSEFSGEFPGAFVVRYR